MIIMAINYTKQNYITYKKNARNIQKLFSKKIEVPLITSYEEILNIPHNHSFSKLCTHMDNRS